MTARPIVIAAGGTGGHMFPALALGRELLARGQPVAFLTDRRGARFLDAGLEVTLVDAGSPSGSLRQRLTGMARLGRGLVQSLSFFRKARPAAAAAFGGYACVPTAVAAACGRVPLLVHEQNAVFGRANRLVARFAARLALSFADTAALPDRPVAGRLVVGNPVRPDFGEASRTYAAPAADGPVRLLVMGGSQGARLFSDVVPAALALLPLTLRSRIELAQQCRPEDLERVGQHYAALGMRVELAAFFADAPRRMKAAHLVVSRSGASTVAELLACGRPSLLVPYAHAADDHQRANAARLEAAGAALVVPQQDADATRLATVIGDLLVEPHLLTGMAEAARGLARPDAAHTLADAMLDLVKGARP